MLPRLQSGGWHMYAGRIGFAQLIDHLPLHSFRRCVQRYRGHDKVQSFSCLDQYLCMAFAQLSYRESLRDIEACLRAQNAKLYHMGIRGTRLARHPGRCQREARLAHLRRLRRRFDRHRPAPLRR